MKLAIGNDHAAAEMKFELKKYLEEKGHEVINFGTDTAESCSYTVYGEKVALAVKSAPEFFTEATSHDHVPSVAGDTLSPLVATFAITIASSMPLYVLNASAVIS